MRSRTWRSWAWLIVVGLAVAVNLLLAVAPAAWIESVWMARLWPAWTAITVRLQAALPVPLTPLLLITLALLGWWLVERRGRGRYVAALLMWLAVVALTFLPAWGAAYRRAPLAETLRLAPGGADRADLLAALEHLVVVVRAAAPEQPLARPAVAVDRDAFATGVAAAAACVQRTDEAITGRHVHLPSSVRRLPEGALLRAGYAGITLPWLLEPYVDAGLPPAAYLSVAAHELTHAAGWAREADTDALAVLAGLRCDHDWVRYAAALHAVQIVSTSLQPLLANDAAARARAAAAVADLPDAARADRAALGDAVRRWRNPALSSAVTAVYDGFLRSQGVQAGVADYDAAGALVAAALAACDTATAQPWCH